MVVDGRGSETTWQIGKEPPELRKKVILELLRGLISAVWAGLYNELQSFDVAQPISIVVDIKGCSPQYEMSR